MSDDHPKSSWRVDPRTGWEIEVRPGESLRSAQSRADAEAASASASAPASVPSSGAPQAGDEVKVVKVAMRQRTEQHARDLEKMLSKGWQLVEVRSGGLFSGKDLATFRRSR